MTLTPSVRAISLCSFPRVANSFARASFVAISNLECFLLAMTNNSTLDGAKSSKPGEPLPRRELTWWVRVCGAKDCYGMWWESPLHHVTVMYLRPMGWRRWGGLMNKMARSNRRNAVLGVQLAHERAWQPRGGLNEDAFRRARSGAECQQSEFTRAARSRECTASRRCGWPRAPDSSIVRRTRPSAIWNSTQVRWSHHLIAVYAVPVEPALFSNSRRQLLAKAPISGLAPCSIADCERVHVFMAETSSLVSFKTASRICQLNDWCVGFL